ncbi:MAG: hypothetical protein KC587_13555, partial [Nitrospira sp.]|nr:hypothetical protein [Nitrospira sp.]
MNISGTVRQIKNQAGKSSTIPGARVTVIVGERELGGMKTDLLGRYGYEEVSDYPGATLVCKVEAKGFHSKTEKVVLEQSTIQLDIELEPIPPEQTWIQWICERLRWMTEWPPIWWAIGGMVAVLFVILLVVDQCTPDNNHPPTPAAMVWKPVGQEAFTEGNARQVTMMVEKNVPYVAYQDVERGKKGTVMKYASEKWSPVGNPGFSAGELTELSLAVEGEQPWVAYRDSVKRFQLTVKKFSGERWES